MKTELENVLPQDIEKRSFEIITEELGEVSLIPGTEPIVKRCIHTSADFEYAKSLKFSEDAVQRAMDAIRDGAWIVTGTQMGKSGINKKKLAQYGGEVCCFMSDEETANMAKEQGTTRAVASMEMIQEGRLKPELIIGVPVGFVNVVQSKELILSLNDTPYIVARGRKGGSNIAACICNALLYMMDEKK